MRRVLRALLAIAVVGVLVWVNPLRANAAAPSLTAPERVYGKIDNPLPFTPGAKDAISDDDLGISVELADTGPACNPTSGNGYDIGPCPRVQMTVNQGSLAIDVDTDFSDPALPDGLAPGGAVFESTNANGTGPTINLNGTDAQINQALETLVYAPDTGDVNDLKTPYILHIIAIDDDAATSNVEADVQIRIDGDNQGPTLTVPPTQNVAAGSTTPLPTTAPAVTTPPTAGDWNVEDIDIKDGDPDDMLIVAWVTCGKFSMRGGSLPVEGTLVDSLDTYVEGLYGTDPAYQADRDALVAGIIAALPPEVATAPIETTDPSTLKTGFAGIGTIDDIVYMLSQVTYEAPAEKGTCDLWTVVTDLGNNGLPLQYVGSPIGGKDDPKPGIEVPDLGIDQNFTTFVVDGGAKLSVPADLTVAEGANLDIPVSIDTDKHPDIPVGFTTSDVSTTAADYTAPAPFIYPENDGGPVNATFTAATDAEVEGDEYVYVSLDVSGDGITADPDTVLVKITDATETTTTTESTTTTTGDPGSTTTIDPGSTTTIDPGSTTTIVVITTTTLDPGTTTTTDPGTTTTTDPGTTTTTDPGTTTTTEPPTTTTTTEPPTTTTTTEPPTTTTTTEPPTTTTTTEPPTTTTTTEPPTTTTTDPGTTTTTDPGTTTTTDPGTTTTTDGSTTTTDGGTTTTTDGSTTTTDGGTTTTGQDGSTTTTGAGGGTTTTDGGVSGGGGNNGGGSGGGNVDDGTLARTGSDSRSLVALGVMAVTMGGIVLIARRRLHLRQG